VSFAYDVLLVPSTAVALLALCVLVFRARGEIVPLTTLELAAREGASADLASWTELFGRLHGIQRQGWRGWLYGPPRFTIELWAEHGTVGVRWLVPTDLEPVFRALIEASLPGFVVVADA
jgi:hypothetical protein